MQRSVPMNYIFAQGEQVELYKTNVRFRARDAREASEIVKKRIDEVVEHMLAIVQSDIREAVNRGRTTTLSVLDFPFLDKLDTLNRDIVEIVVKRLLSALNEMGYVTQHVYKNVEDKNTCLNITIDW